MLYEAGIIDKSKTVRTIETNLRPELSRWLEQRHGNLREGIDGGEVMDLTARLDAMETAIKKPSFRQSSGKANEVNYWILIIRQRRNWKSVSGSNI